MRTRAFTLIELMIAIGLGSLIAYSAVAGFRVASQSVTMVNRLALENSLMRIGCQQAHERLDFWTDYDNPETGGAQPLRGKDGTGGQPFTPMATVFPLVVNHTDPEQSTGWDVGDAWSMADPRVWWHGALAEKNSSSQLLGRYSIFGSTSHSQTGLPALGPPPEKAYGTVTVPHSWQYGQIWGMMNALGYYGYADYMPANTLFACYMPVGGGTNLDGMPGSLINPYSQFSNGEGAQEYVKDLWRLTMGTAYYLASPTSSAVDATNPASQRAISAVGYYGNSSTQDDFKKYINVTAQLIGGGGPSSWPMATAITAHFIKTGRFVAMAQVTWVSPLTGQSVQVAFTSLATTLRGARLQRGQAGGWADWDDRAGAINSPTLDDTP